MVEVAEFETTDPALRGETTITISARPMQTVAPMSAPCMTGYRAVGRPPTTRLARVSVTAILGFIAVLPRCHPGTRKVVGATGFEPATPCAQGKPGRASEVLIPE